MLWGIIEGPGNVQLLKEKTYGTMRDIFMNLSKKVSVVVLMERAVWKWKDAISSLSLEPSDK